MVFLKWKKTIKAEIVVDAIDAPDDRLPVVVEKIHKYFLWKVIAKLKQYSMHYYQQLLF